MENRTHRWLRAIIWIVISAPILAGLFDFTIGVLSLDRGTRGKDAILVASAVIDWLKTPSTLLFLHQLALKGIRAMPPPPGECNFWCRWGYDFLQMFADNTDLVGKKAPEKLLEPEKTFTHDNVS